MFRLFDAISVGYVPAVAVANALHVLNERLRIELGGVAAEDVRDVEPVPIHRRRPVSREGEFIVPAVGTRRGGDTDEAWAPVVRGKARPAFAWSGKPTPLVDHLDLKITSTRGGKGAGADVKVGDSIFGVRPGGRRSRCSGGRREKGCDDAAICH